MAGRIQKTGFARRNSSSVDWAFYSALSLENRRSEVSDYFVPAEGGLAFAVQRGEIVRITCHEGPQVCDLNAFALDDPSEHFWSGRTRTLEGAHLSTGNCLWSTEPQMRIMFTIIADTVPHPQLHGNADSHDLIFARCSARSRALLRGPGDHPNCNDNLVKALLGASFSPKYVHDALNVFMTTGVDENQRLTIHDPAARTGDYLELYAEIDVMVALSACPSDCNGGSSKPLLAQVFKPDRPKPALPK